MICSHDQNSSFLRCNIIQGKVFKSPDRESAFFFFPNMPESCRSVPMASRSSNKTAHLWGRLLMTPIYQGTRHRLLGHQSAACSTKQDLQWIVALLPNEIWLKYGLDFYTWFAEDMSVRPLEILNLIIESQLRCERNSSAPGIPGNVAVCTAGMRVIFVTFFLVRRVGCKTRLGVFPT